MVFVDVARSSPPGAPFPLGGPGIGSFIPSSIIATPFNLDSPDSATNTIGFNPSAYSAPSSPQNRNMDFSQMSRNYNKRNDAFRQILGGLGLNKSSGSNGSSGKKGIPQGSRIQDIIAQKMKALKNPRTAE